MPQNEDLHPEVGDPEQIQTDEIPSRATVEFGRLVEIIARLRAPGGCPWDREQTHESLKRYLLEEAYEALEAIDASDPDKLCEELGDVLIQVVLHAQLAAEQQQFDIEQIARRTARKLIWRHPHVFGRVKVSGSGEVLANWERLKRREPSASSRTSVLDGIPRALPALQQAVKIQKKVARVGFDWSDARGPLAKVREELGELEEAQAQGEQEAIEAELGDLLFALANLARFLQADPEDALRRANERFATRFRAMERLSAERGLQLADLSLAQMDELWEQVKGEES